MQVVHHEVIFRRGDPNKSEFAWIAECTCQWMGVGPTKECVEIIAAGHDLDDDPDSPAELESSMLRTDNLLTRDNLGDIFSMLSQSTRDLVRKEIHEAHIAAHEDVANEKDGSVTKDNIKEQESLSLLAMQVIDGATAEFTSLDEKVTISAATKAEPKLEPKTYDKNGKPL